MPKKAFEGSAIGDKLEVGSFTRLELVKLILACNRKRRQFIKEHEWGEPTWDILLQSYVFFAEQLDVTSTAISYETGLPHALSKRYIKLLIEKGLLTNVETSIKSDALAFRLSARGFEALDDWLGCCAEATD